jgi:hypothetical protein
MCGKYLVWKILKNQLNIKDFFFKLFYLFFIYFIVGYALSPSSFKTPNFLLIVYGSEGVVHASTGDGNIRNQFTHRRASGRDIYSI